MYKHQQVTQQGSEIVVICNQENVPEGYNDNLNPLFKKWQSNCETFRFADGEYEKVKNHLESDVRFGKFGYFATINHGIQCDQIVIKDGLAYFKDSDDKESQDVLWNEVTDIATARLPYGTIMDQLRKQFKITRLLTGDHATNK